VSGLIAITRDELGIAEQLREKLIQHNYQAEIVDVPPENVHVFIMLDFIVKNDINSLTDKYLNAFRKIKTIAKKYTEQGGILITVQDTGGYFGLKNKLSQAHAKLSGLTGIVKTAAIEWPKAECRAIDLNCTHQTPEILAQMLCDEFMYFYHDKDKEIGLPFEGSRIKLETHPETITHLPSIALKKKSVFVVTGGARGITAACIIALAKKQACRFVLLGRSELTEEPRFCHDITDLKQLKATVIQHFMKEKEMNPKKIDEVYKLIIANREIQQTLSTLQELGSQAWYISVDVNQKEKVSLALELVRKKWGTIDGIIHGAGVLADKLIVDKSEEQFKTVFETKVNGLENLLQLTSQDKLSYLYFFSSVAGRYGNRGQSDYAAANEVLNKMAEFEVHHRKSCQVKSFNWAPWESGMVDENLMKIFKENHIPLLSLHEGTEYFVSEVLQVNPQSEDVEIIFGDLNSTEKKQDQLKNQMNQQNIFTLNVANDVYLNSHIIHNHIVVPACLVLDWFMRSCNNNRFICRNFKVLKGIQLEKNTQHASFCIQTTKMSSYYQLKLLDDHNNIKYTADFSENSQLIESKLPQSQMIDQPWPWKTEEIYQSQHSKGPLFHGEYFYAIKKLLSFSHAGGSAILHSYQSLAKEIACIWPKENWKCDILTLDGALQLLLLWTKAHLGKSSLPVSIEEVVLYQSTLPTQEVHCEFTSIIIDKYRTKSTVHLFDHRNNIYAKLFGVEMCVINEKVPA